ncbi:putative ferric-chelate reductase [Phaeomoniella chlamydospora]|uniref:Putative ferric-chelate reductase n=1 Tax=Phaeomoniella chlamydospora TaxID=158046 RepID=A0A0G2EIL5_PHACM|nr:putative ferric-chelate reductase [Phaeomoniella chlamydospora]
MNLIASGCGVRLDSYALMHRWLGRVAIVEALVHTVAAAVSHPLNFKRASDIAALTACITIAVILLSSIGYIRRHFYEIFSKAHLVLVALALAAIYVHTPSKNPFTVPKVYLLVAAGSGFTGEPELEALVEGPYGRELDLESYGTVLLFATGIGIAGQLPYVTQLLEGYHDCKVKTRRIALFWELDSELHAAWVADMMKELLRRDTKRILDIRLFILGNFLSNQTHLGDNARPGERIDMTYKPMDAEDLIESEMECRKGRTVVSLCTNDERSNEIREIVRCLLDKDIHLKELEFRPPPASEYKKDRKGPFNADRSKRTIEKV